VRRSLIVEGQASSCYFRTSVDGDARKALIQITERCNLHCAHCFVSSTAEGADLSLAQMVEVILPRLRAARVSRVTFTGGEPFVHPDLVAMTTAYVGAGMSVGICTNATQTTDEQIAALATLGGVHVNISFDGFRAESHGKFRGNQASFDVSVATARKFAAAGLLQGLLSTPNTLTRPQEFADLCSFAADIGAEYVLMNPLSSFGRGVKAQSKLAADVASMAAIRAVTDRFRERLDVVDIRFPNTDLPLAGCDAGRIIYVFADGQTALCPYLVFAARTPQSQHRDTEFLVGNILTDPVDGALDGYNYEALRRMGDNPTCSSCGIAGRCGKGCPAAVISRGGVVGDVDREQCPVVAGPVVLPMPVLRV
jgi:radical SAM protein with 4Fe4S-binding SPASM domain